MLKWGKKSIIFLSLFCSIGFLACSKKVDKPYDNYEHLNTNRFYKEQILDDSSKYNEEAGIVRVDDYDKDEITLIARVTASSLNIRSGPSTDTKIIDNVKKDTILQCLEDGDQWVKILYDNSEAYVYAEYVSVEETSTSTSNITTGIQTNQNKHNSDYSYEKLKDIEIVENYTYDMMVEDIDLFASKYKDIFSAKPIAATADKRFIYELVVGKSNAQKHVVIYAGMHASDHMTSELAMKQIEFYLSNFGDYEDLFSEIAFHIFPMVNPDGVTLSQFGDDAINEQEYRESVRRWYFRDIALQVSSLGKPDYYRSFDSNLKGVDIYYNFPYKWDEFSGNIVPGASLYKGSFALSEEESNALYKQIKKIVPIAVIGYHANGQDITWNYGQTGEVYSKSYSLFEKLSKITNYKDAGQAADFGFDAWVVSEWNIPSLKIRFGSDNKPYSIDDFSKMWSDSLNLWEVFN